MRLFALIALLLAGCSDQVAVNEHRIDLDPSQTTIYEQGNIVVVTMTDDHARDVMDEGYEWGHRQKNIVYFLNGKRLGVCLQWDRQNPRIHYLTLNPKFAGLDGEGE